MVVQHVHVMSGLKHRLKKCLSSFFTYRKQEVVRCASFCTQLFLVESGCPPLVASARVTRSTTIKLENFKSSKYFLMDDRYERAGTIGLRCVFDAS